jgi:hypothetical protein
MWSEAYGKLKQQELNQQIPWCRDMSEDREKDRLPMKQRCAKPYRRRDVRQSRPGEGRAMGAHAPSDTGTD